MTSSDRIFAWILIISMYIIKNPIINDIIIIGILLIAWNDIIHTIHDKK